jgi:H+-transporting ATPase
VVLLIAALPVAMPTMFTLNMALGASTLAKEGVLVTRLSATEDAAAMDVLCVDKTGTVTQNKLFVEKELPANGYSADDVIHFGALASNDSDQDPIDLAFLTAAKNAGVGLDSYQKLEFVPFDPQTRMTGATIQGPSGKFCVRKGSMQAIRSVLGPNGDGTSTLDSQSEELAAEGMRALAVAKGSPGGGFQLVGLVGVADRVRADAKDVVEALNGLGVSTKMLTGDALPIAKSVAQQIGLTGEVNKAPPGQKLGQISVPEALIERSAGLAEIYPEDKYAVVKSLQDAGHVVGMTGDGVNDSPALKQAEVGIAVKGAMDVAKDSASVVLVTDGLAGAVALVKTARTTYQRLQNWVLNLVTKKTFVIAYIVAMLILTGYFVISVLGMVLVLFLGDFATMSASSDNVRYSAKPSSFNIPWLFRLAASLGLAITVEGIALTLAAISYFGLAGNIGRIYTFGFAYLVLAGIFNLFIVRERLHFWESRPSSLLVMTGVAEVLVVCAVSLFGFLGLSPIGLVPLLAVLAFSAVTSFAVNDSLKVSLLRRFAPTEFGGSTA